MIPRRYHTLFFYHYVRYTVDGSCCEASWREILFYHHMCTFILQLPSHGSIIVSMHLCRNGISTIFATQKRIENICCVLQYKLERLSGGPSTPSITLAEQLHRPLRQPPWNLQCNIKLRIFQDWGLCPFMHWCICYHNVRHLWEIII